ncbi:MAG: ROK family transcriptional regulator [Allorhizobium sp.]
MPARSSTERLRLSNSLLVLKALRRESQLSHTEIAERTGLSSATISAITATLEIAGVIEKLEQQAATGRGRPRVLFAQRRDACYMVVIIVSSDSIQYSLVDYGGILIDRFQEARVLVGVGSFLAAIRAALDRLAVRSRIEPAQVRAISISSKGLVAADDEPVLLWSPVLGGERVDFRAGLAPHWKARILLSNETLLVAGALAVRQAAQGIAEPGGLAALSLGHSIGLGIATRRAGGDIDVVAPNFGHMLHVPNGALCRCGARGCIEAYAGFYAILRNAFKVPKDTIPAKFVPLVELDKLAASARQGHRMANFAFREAGLALGYGLSRVLSFNGYLSVTITGPGARYYDLMQAGLEEGLSQAQVVRMQGPPALSVHADEPLLVFEGHHDRALSVIDEDILMSGHGPAGETV